MSDERFIESDADDFERVLLSSAQRDAIDPEKKRALAVALGVSLVAASAAPAAASAAKVGAAAASAAHAKGGLSLVILSKWIAGLLFTSALAVGATKVGLRAYETERARERDERALAMASRPSGAETARSMSGTNAGLVAPSKGEPDPAETASDPAPPSSVQPSRVTATASGASERVASQRPATSTPKAAGSTTTVRPAALEQPREAPVAELRPTVTYAPERKPSLADELRIIESARTSLSFGDLHATERTLDMHDANFPHGAFADESRVLRIDLFARSGQKQLASDWARAFLAAHPRSAHAPRVRQWLGEAP